MGHIEAIDMAEAEANEAHDYGTTDRVRTVAGQQGALDETPAEEFSRLVIEYNEGERQYRAEAWNLIADFALEHCDAILRGLSAPPSQVAPANPAQVTEALNQAKDWISENIREGDIAGCTLLGKLAALTAAIGAGGQAVAVTAKEMDAALDRFETAAFAKFANLPRGKADREKAIASRAAEYNSSRQAILSALSQPHPADERVVEALNTIEEWQKWALTWAGSAFLSGETISPDDMTEAEHKCELYSGMCKLSNYMIWLRDEIAALSAKECR